MCWQIPRCLLVLTLASFLIPVRARAAGPDGDLAGAIRIALGKSFDTDWSGLEKLPAIRWAPLPPTMLQNCLPDGGCFTRQGTMAAGGRNLVVLATGARTIVSNIYFRNPAAPIGEAAVLATLKQAGFASDLVRCPIQGAGGGTDWYRLRSAAANPGFLAVQTSCNGRPCEGFTLTLGDELPRLQPNQLRMYSEQCSGTASERKPVATVMPQEALARTIVALIPPSGAAAASDWKSVQSRLPEAQWNPRGPMKSSLTYKSDPNPYTNSGSVTLSGRQFSVEASGTTSQAKVVYLDENGMHPTGENLMRAVWSEGFAVKLARCGPVYTQSTNNWYAVTSPKTLPVMVQQSIRYEGKQVQDSYAIRLDGTLPVRDPRDRDPGVNGCR